jgi:hypothetical protein
MTGKCPASPALGGGIKGHNIKKTPYREDTTFRAWNFIFSDFTATYMQTFQLSMKKE